MSTAPALGAIYEQIVVYILILVFIFQVRLLPSTGQGILLSSQVTVDQIIYKASEWSDTASVWYILKMHQ